MKKVPAAQGGLFDVVVEKMFGESEEQKTPPRPERRPVPSSVRLFHPSGEDVVEQISYRKDFRFTDSSVKSYVALLERTQKRVGTTIVVSENGVVVSHHTLEKDGWVRIEERA